MNILNQISDRYDKVISELEKLAETNPQYFRDGIAELRAAKEAELTKIRRNYLFQSPQLLAASSENSEKNLDEESETGKLTPITDIFTELSLNPVFKAAALKVKERNAKLLAQHAERIRDTYGDWINDYNVLKILEVENERKICKTCSGETCKINSNYWKPIVQSNAKNQTISIAYYICNNGVRIKAQKSLERKLSMARIPSEYLGKTFADYDVDELNKNAVACAKKLVEHADRGAYFFGSVGTGKTLLAAIIAQEIIKNGRTVIFATVPNISTMIRSTFKDNSEYSETEILDQLYTVPTLILDDVGMEVPTKFVCETISRIINARYNSKLQTIMTSNLSLGEMREVHNHPQKSPPTLDGTRIYDRCKQMCVPVELKGTSRRF